jgi:hypothetical protein
MSVKKKPKLELKGIAPNLLLKDVENTAPWLFRGEIDTQGADRAYLAKLVFYKKNLKALQHIDLSEYFHICLSAHWATAGTFVPTNVDNQIREGLWRHEQVGAHLSKMAQLTIQSWSWDYQEVTNRKSINPLTGQIMSTHEGTWLSVAIGGHCALIKNKRDILAQEVADVILAEIDKEEKLLIEFREKRDHVNFLRSCALMAHNFGDLDRVIDQWQMPLDDPFRKRIYKLGHEPNQNYSPVLAFAGQVNKNFLSVENHRHMSMRQPKCLRRSPHFLIPVGPFMDDWGKKLGETDLLSIDEKGEIICALFDGYRRQDMAQGYTRAMNGMLEKIPGGLDALSAAIPFDLMLELKRSKFYEIAQLNMTEFENLYKKKLESFRCPITSLQF